VKNRNIHFKATAGLPIPLLVACFAAVFISAPIPAIAAGQVPFNASFTTEFTTEFVPPFYLRVFVTGEGNASHMGRTTAVTTDQLVNLQDGSGSASQVRPMGPQVRLCPPANCGSAAYQRSLVTAFRFIVNKTPGLGSSRTENTVRADL